MTRKKKSNWQIKIEDVSEKDGSKEILQLILKNRDISDIPAFIEPDLSYIPSSGTLHDSTTAAKKILSTINEEKKIFIHGDYDADGICATTLLWEFFYRELSESINKKVDVLPFIPSRKDDGYGLSESSIEQLIEKGADMIITVDCGIRDLELIKKYPHVEFIITDHHQPGDDLIIDEGCTLVHPFYPDHEFSLKTISGTFVAFLLVQEIKKEAGLLEPIQKGIKGLDLVALSTVTDIMPLIDINRVAVKFGIEQIRSRTRKGLDALIKIAKISPLAIDSYHLGYVIGPRINAAGRIGDPMDAVRLLSSEENDRVNELALKIDDLNKDRQELTEKLLAEAEKQIEGSEDVVIVIGDDWEEGIIGLVAGKLMEDHGKPTLVMSRKDEIRGSARSFGGFNITQALEKVSEHLLRFGGHAEAAGFTLEVDKFKDFAKAIKDYSHEILNEIDLQKDRSIEMELCTSQTDLDLVLELKRLEPFGHKNPKPLFLIKDVVISNKRVMGSNGNHMKLTVKGDGVETLDCLMFNGKEDISELEVDDVIDVVGYLDLNEWNGVVSIQFIVSEWDKSVL
jgi:single-stranded-DNA-specific exonuclease